MSVFDYIGLTICGLFFIVFGLAAIRDFIYEMKSGVGNKWILFPLWSLIIWGCYEGLQWVYYY